MGGTIRQFESEPSPQKEQSRGKVSPRAKKEADEMTIIESRYSDFWFCFNCDYWEIAEDEIFDGLNGGDCLHFDFIKKSHHFPIGVGRTPDKALKDFNKEKELFNKDIAKYKIIIINKMRSMLYHRRKQ